MSLRRRALEALLEITEKGAYANLHLKQAAQGLPKQNAKWLYAAVYGTLDHLYTIDYMLSHMTQGRQKPPIRGILRMGAHELLFMRVPVAVACNESVQLAKEIGKGAMAGYINGVLRALSRRLEDLPPLPKEAAQRLHIQYSWPIWLVEEWLQRFGETETQALLGQMEGAQGMRLRAQPPYTTRELEQALTTRGIGFSPGSLTPDCLHLEQGFDIACDPLYQAGRITAQGEGAMFACLACDIQPGMRVLDACAAPGGKSAYLYALAQGALELHAWELHPHRLQLMQRTFQRLRVSARTRLQDASQYLEEYEGYFDVVLLDVPCSGLGVAGAKPDIRYAKSPEAIDALAQTQRRILHTCARYVRPGGYLLYASCTISKKENEQQMAAFLQSGGFHLAPLPSLGLAAEDAQRGFVQLLPHRHATEGFFIARMQNADETRHIAPKG